MRELAADRMGINRERQVKPWNTTINIQVFFSCAPFSLALWRASMLSVISSERMVFAMPGRMLSQPASAGRSGTAFGWKFVLLSR